MGTEPRLGADPACSQHPKQVAVGEQEDIPLGQGGVRSGDDSIRTGADLPE